MAEYRWDVEFESFQHDFLISCARFPAFIAGWGTGKTMTALAKGMALSARYPDNLGLVLRKNFTDLRDSTMTDFESYTGLRVRSQDKSVRLPNGSKIIFHHADELSGIVQNINLGWFFIEQAEEFETDEVFEKLGGRLRREGCFRQGFIIGNTNGHNWIWRKWKNRGSPDYICDKEYNPRTGVNESYSCYGELFEATTYDNKGHLPEDYITSLGIKKETSPSNYRRFVMNSWEATDTADAVIPYEDLLNSVNSEVFVLHNKRKIVACDPAEFGDDKTVIMVLDEYRIIEMVVLSKKEPMETAGRILRLMRKYHIDQCIIDSIGIGAGIRSRLSELGVQVEGVNSGSSSVDKENFRNLKAEIWMNAQDLFREGVVSLTDDSRLMEDLATVRYVVNSKGQIAIEKKSDTKQRLGRSPDFGDCFVLGLYGISKMPKITAFASQIEEDEVSQAYTTKTVL